MSRLCIESAALASFRNALDKFKEEMIQTEEETGKLKDLYDVCILINDLPINLKLMLLKPSKLEEVSSFSGASLSIKGHYITPEEKNNDVPKDQYLQLHVKGPNKQALLLALQMLEHLAKESGGVTEKKTLGQVEKVLVGMEIAPAQFELRGRLVGLEGSNLQYIVDETEADVSLRGRGSGYIEPDIGKESPEPLHIRIQHERAEVVQAARILALHLVETVQREFADFCCLQAQALASQTASFQEKAPSSPPSGHNMLEDLKEFDTWLNNRASPKLVKDYEKECLEPSKTKRLKLDEKKTSYGQKNSVHDNVNTCIPYKGSDGHVGEENKDSTHRKRGKRGGVRRRISKENKIMFRHYCEILEELQNKHLHPEQRKELIERIKILKESLSTYWYVKEYGDKDFDTQYQKFCIERREEKKLPLEEQGKKKIAPQQPTQPRQSTAFQSQLETRFSTTPGPSPLQGAPQQPTQLRQSTAFRSQFETRFSTTPGPSLLKGAPQQPTQPRQSTAFQSRLKTQFSTTPGPPSLKGAPQQPTQLRQSTAFQSQSETRFSTTPGPPSLRGDTNGVTMQGYSPGEFPPSSRVRHDKHSFHYSGPVAPPICQSWSPVGRPVSSHLTSVQGQPSQNFNLVNRSDFSGNHKFLGPNTSIGGPHRPNLQNRGAHGINHQLGGTHGPNVQSGGHHVPQGFGPQSGGSHWPNFLSGMPRGSQGSFESSSLRMGPQESFRSNPQRDFDQGKWGHQPKLFPKQIPQVIPRPQWPPGGWQNIKTMPSPTNNRFSLPRNSWKP